MYLPIPSSYTLESMSHFSCTLSVVLMSHQLTFPNYSLKASTLAFKKSYLSLISFISFFHRLLAMSILIQLLGISLLFPRRHRYLFQKMAATGLILCTETTSSYNTEINGNNRRNPPLLNCLPISGSAWNFYEDVCPVCLYLFVLGGVCYLLYFA